MFGQHFYHQRVRKAVSGFGSLFNNMHIIRTDSSNNVISQVKVPLAYSPRVKYLERIREFARLPEDETVAIKLPRMSFEMTSFQYDATRQIAKTNRFGQYSNNQQKKLFYTGTPYNLYFSLNIYCKTHDDALQIVEQILPYFSPTYTLTLKPFADYPEILEDVPLTLVSSSFSDDYEGALETGRTIIYTLDFEMKVTFYGPIGDRSIIRKIQNNYYLIGSDSDGLTTNITINPDPLDVSPDSDYGFLVTKTDYLG